MAADLSVVLTTHREGVLVPRTIRSLADAAGHAANHGLACELVIVLDDPDPLTRDIIAGLEIAHFVATRIVEVRVKSPGPARNAGVAAATGAYLTTTDGDDLVSFNYLLDMYRVAASAGGLAMAFPEYQVVFGDDDFVCKTFALARAGKARFAEDHTHTSRGLAAREVFLAIPFRDCKISPLYVYEDYDFNLRAAAAGVRLIEAEDVVFFYRARRNSFMTSLHDAGRYLPPPSEFFHPYVVLRPDDAAVEPAPPTPAVDAGIRAFQGSERLAVLTRHAGAMDPEIELARIRAAPRASNLDIPTAFGAAYRDICAKLRDARFTDVVLAPAAGAGVAFLHAVIAATIAAAPTRSVLMLGEGDGAPPPTGARVLDLRAAGRDLDAFHRAKLAVRTIETFAPDGLLHLLDGPLTGTFCTSFTDALRDFAVVAYYSPPARPDGGAAPDPAQFAMMSRYFALIDKVFCDDAEAAAGLTAIIADYAAKLTLVDPREGALDATLAQAYRDLEQARPSRRWAPLGAAARALASSARPAVAPTRPAQPPASERLLALDAAFQAARRADAAAPRPAAGEPASAPPGKWQAAARRLNPFRA